MRKVKSGISLTEGDISKHVLRLALPIVASLYLQSAFLIVDLYWVSKLGKQAAAAVASGSFIVWMVEALTGMIGIGAMAIIARSIGAGDREAAAVVSRQSLVLGVIFSVFTTIIGISASPAILRFMGNEPEVVRMGESFLQIIFSGIFTVYIFFILTNIYKGSGDTLTPMIFLIVSVSINMLLDPLLIFGISIFPEMGIQGAGVATVLSTGIGSVIAILKMPRGFLPGKLIDLKPDFLVFARILRVGAPYALAGLLFCIVYIILSKITTLFGTEAMAALGIGHKVESLSYYACLGFGAAAAALVGQNLGAGKPARAARSAWTSVLMISVINALLGLLFFIFSDRIIMLFIDDPLVIGRGGAYLRIIALSELFMGLEIVLEGAFSGAGNTVPPMVISILFSVARIPLAQLLSLHFGLGVNGVWWAISITTIIKGALMALWFYRGKWKGKKIA